VISQDRIRALALALPLAVEQDHHGFPSFRVKGKIFATMPDAARLHVMLPEAQIDAALAPKIAALEELWWGKRRCGVRVDPGRASVKLVETLLKQAWTAKAGTLAS